MNRFAVRPLERGDIPHIIDYWVSASPEHLLAMGADASKIPERPEWQGNLGKILETPEREATAFYLVWLVDSRPIGFNSLKNIKYGQSAEMHLHLWEESSRGKGYGGVLFCLAAVDFFRRFSVKTIICEPSASNPAPNRMLQRIGFPRVLTHTAATSELSLVCEVNRYSIDRETAEAYLLKRNA